MSMDYIRQHYGVPAKRGGRVKFDGQWATIVASDQQYLKVRLDGETRAIRIHPTWHVEYTDGAS